MEDFMNSLFCLLYSEKILTQIKGCNVHDYEKLEIFLKEDPNRIYLILKFQDKINATFFYVECSVCHKIYTFPYSMIYKCKTCSYKNFIFCEDCAHSKKIQKHLTHDILYTTLHRLGCLFYQQTDVYDLENL